MNILLLVLQILLALHTLTGAVWKFSNTVPSLSALPQNVWLGLAVLEILCVTGLILPIFVKKLGKLVPLAALVIAGEMVLFCIVSSASGSANQSELTYWIVVAVLCLFIAFARWKLKPIKP